MNIIVKTILEEYGGEKPEDVTWAELADRFELWQDRDTDFKTKMANNKWRQFLGTKRGLEFKKATIGKDGALQSYTIGRANEPDPIPETDGMDIKFITKMPSGGAYVRYEKSEQYGLTNDEAKEVGDVLLGQKFKTPNIKGNGIGMADFSDIHTGAVLKYAMETVKTKGFDFEILTGYMDEAAAIVNSYKFNEVHVFMPGDFVESFTAFNHRDTWKHLMAHQGGVVILAYKVLQRLLSNIKNVKRVYIVEGNHDRLTAEKEGNSRKGVAEVLSFFLSENSNFEIEYHPWMVRKEIDGVYHMMSHGDFKAFKKNDFWFRYGKQDMYNVYRTGHFHGFNILRHTHENLHYQCPSIFTGNFFSETLGFDAVPAITICQHTAGVPKLDYRPLTTFNHAKIQTVDPKGLGFAFGTTGQDTMPFVGGQ